VDIFLILTDIVVFYTFFLWKYGNSTSKKNWCFKYL